MSTTVKADAATGRDWAGLAVLVLPCLLVSMDGHVLNLATPAIAAALRPSGAQLLWIMDGYVFLVGGSLLAMGALGDRIGRRRLLLIGVTLFAVTSLGGAFSRTPAELIGARLLMGVAGASLMPSTLALIRNMFTDRRQRTVAVGIWSASFSLGGLVGPVAGGALLTHFWWGSVFLPALPVALLLLTLGPRLLPESRASDAGRFDVLGATQSLIALLAIICGVKLAAEGGDRIHIAALFMVGTVLAAVFVSRQRRVTQPMINPALFRTPGVRVMLATNMLTFFALYATQVAVAQYLQWCIGLSAFTAGLWTLPSVFAYLAASVLGPVAARRFSSATVIVAGLAVIAAGCALLTLVVVTGPGAPGDLALIVVGGSLFSIGLGPVYAMSTEMIVSSARKQEAGAAGAVTETGAELGGALGIALLGSLGVAVYRHLMIGNDSLPQSAATAASRTAGDATAVAATLPSVQAAELLTQARTAFEAAFSVISGSVTVIMIGLAVVGLIRLHRNRHAG
ncbi:MAG TPA: MFS transporter [Actinoplanes sp.]|jgi:DHA2 family multidrug resistance protein-like MFS transporter